MPSTLLPTRENLRSFWLLSLCYCCSSSSSVVWWWLTVLTDIRAMLWRMRKIILNLSDEIPLQIVCLRARSHRCESRGLMWCWPWLALSQQFCEWIWTSEREKQRWGVRNIKTNYSWMKYHSLTLLTKLRKQQLNAAKSRWRSAKKKNLNRSPSVCDRCDVTCARAQAISRSIRDRTGLSVECEETCMWCITRHATDDVIVVVWQLSRFARLISSLLSFSVFDISTLV